MRNATALLCAILVLAASGRAEDDPRKTKLASQFDLGNRYAVIVGINQFDDKKALSPLRFCVADARLLADVLVQRCGYPAENITLLTDDGPADLQPTRENILAKTTEVLKKVQFGDTVVFYMSCHGGVANGQSHLCPKDFDSNHAGLTHISVEWIRDMVQSSKAAQKLVVLDACHTGASMAVSGLTPGLGGDISKTMLAGGLITFAAASASQSAQENAELQHGLFTYYLSEGLGGKADRDADGIVDSDELYSYVLKEANLDGAFLAGANLQGADLTEATFREADLSGVDLRNAKLEWTRFTRTNFTGANLEGGDLSHVRLDKVKLRNANLRNLKGIGTGEAADFRDSDLRGADLSGLSDEMSKSVFKGAKYDKFTKWPSGFDPAAAGAVKVE